MKRIRTVTRIFSEESTIIALAAKLVRASQWFEVEPLPDGEYGITVKAENNHLLPFTAGTREKVHCYVCRISVLPIVDDHERQCPHCGSTDLEGAIPPARDCDAPGHEYMERCPGVCECGRPFSAHQGGQS